MLGSRIAVTAASYSRRVKRALERDAPLMASALDLERGSAFDALACLQDDYGAFRPVGRSEKWQDREFTVQQLDGVSLDDKESSVTAWGMDSGFLGGRYDIVIWDDLVDKSTYRTEDARSRLKEWWDTEAETRLEPGGLLLLQGQRLSNLDLYRYCLDKRDADENPMYRHVVFPAHDESKCTGTHIDLAPWPDSCLLDPVRLPWKELQRHQRNPRLYQTVYQQQDGPSASSLVDPAWITGGVDADGDPVPGCRDLERDLRVVPEHLVGRGWSFVTVDPSPSNLWACLWWVWDPEAETLFLIDMVNRRMSPQEFLAMDLDTRVYSGVLKDWTDTAMTVGAPISHVIVEVNAAQRWMINQPYMQKWMERTGQVIVPHTTSRNKLDPKFGVESIGYWFRQGRVRLPWGSGAARLLMSSLVREVTNYPDYDTDDIVMSTWFAKLGTERHYTAPSRTGYARPVPAWLRNAERGIA